jgi:hypothetical protein
MPEMHLGSYAKCLLVALHKIMPTSAMHMKVDATRDDIGSLGICYILVTKGYTTFLY